MPILDHWMINRRFAPSMLLVLLSFSAQGAIKSLDLGPAGGFNAVILEDMYGQMSDVEGRLAVGGGLQLNHFAVGMELNDSHNNSDSLIVGGDATFTNGRVYHGNATIGGEEHIDETVGFYSDDAYQPNGQILSGTPLDFTELGRELQNKSSSWGNLAANGSTLKNEWGEVRVQGNQQTNIFNIDAADLGTASSFWFDIPEQTTALINVFGDNIDMSAFGFFHTALTDGNQQMPDNQPGVFRHDGWLTDRILFNFVDATQITLHSIGIKGSILAPQADVSFYNGHIDGNFIAKSLSSPEGEYTGQINDYRFSAVAVPEPGLLALFLVGLVLLGRKHLLRC